MSAPIRSSLTPATEFEARFGTPPNAQDASGDCQRWERLCASLLQERASLQAELEKMRAEKEATMRDLLALLCKDFRFDLTMEEVYAQVDRQTSLAELIAEIEQEAKE